MIRLSLLATCFVSIRVVAQDYTLTSLNSSLGLNVASGGSGPAGITSWVVDGVNQLNFQSFYYRIGSGQEYALDNITSTPVVTYTGSGIGITYANSSFNLKLSYDLFGNPIGSQNSGLGYSVQILNNQATALDLHLFQYSDYNLGGNSGSQSVGLKKITGGPPALRIFNSAGQTSGAMWMTNVFSLTSLPSSTPLAEAGVFNTTLQNLTDAGQTELNNVASAGPDNVTYAIQWGVSLSGNTSASLSGSFTMAVPEPTSFSLVVVSMLGLGMSVRRKSLASKSE